MAAPSIAAIPCLYKDRYYRSKLETKWAFFFDEMGVEYTYEPQGFELPDGRRYCPDFYLRQIKSFAEVKPDTEKLPSQIWNATEFLLAGMGERILFLVDEPWFKPYSMIRPVRLADGDAHQVTNAILDIHFYPKLFMEEHRLFEDVPNYAFEQESDFTVQYRDAVYLARAARFDHGEQGVPDHIREQIMRRVRSRPWEGC